MVALCQNCGSSLSNTSKFCTNCGYEITSNDTKPRSNNETTVDRSEENEYSSIKKGTSYFNRTEPEHFRGYYNYSASQPGWDQYSYQQQPQYNYYNPYQYYYPPPQYYYPPPQPPKDYRHIFAGIVVLPSYVFLGIILIINLISLIIGIRFVFPELYSNTAFIVIPYPWPNFVFPIEVTGGFSQIWYAFIVASIIISVAWLIKSEGKEFKELFLSSARKIYPPSSKSKNSFVIIAQCFLALWFLNIIVVLFLLFFGMDSTTETPVSGDDLATWEIFFALANASVAEEIFTRILYIGLPLLFVDYVIRKKPKKLHQYFLGGGFEMDKVTVTLIVFSSLTFGFAHMPSWGLWKVFPTTAAGLALGYLFTKKGIHTSIILHFLTNYMGIITILFEDNLTILFAFASILGIMMFVWFFAGIVYFGVYLNEIYDYITRKLFYPTLNAQPVDANMGDINYVKVTSNNKIQRTNIQEQHTDKEPIEVIWHTDSASRERVQYDNWYQQSYYGPGHPGYRPPEYNAPTPLPVREINNQNFRSCPWCNAELYFNYQNGYWYCNRCYRYII